MYAANTDVVIVLFAYVRTFNAKVWLYTGHNYNSRRYIAVNTLAKNLRSVMCTALCALLVFTWNYFCAAVYREERRKLDP